MILYCTTGIILTHSDLLHLLFICEMRYGMKLHDAVEAALAGHCRSPAADKVAAAAARI